MILMKLKKNDILDFLYCINYCHLNFILLIKFLVTKKKKKYLTILIIMKRIIKIRIIKIIIMILTIIFNNVKLL